MAAHRDAVRGEPALDAVVAGTGGGLVIAVPVNRTGVTGRGEANDFPFGGAAPQHPSAAPAPQFRPAAAPAPSVQVAMQLGKAAQDGMGRLSIRLDPPELGRVDIRIDLGHDGRVTAAVAADRPDTLDLLQRDQRSLERALQNAGFDTGSGDLSFSLHRHGQGGGHGDGRPGTGRGGDGGEAAEDDALPVSLRPFVRDRALDISV